MNRETKTILLVDDEPEDLESAGAPLRAAGNNVLEANNYDNALSIFEKHRDLIDLLISDISLPGDNGCELARKVLATKPGLKLLFVSGYAGSEVCRFYGLSISDVHFLRKPFSGAELVDRVRRVLDSAEPFLVNNASAEDSSLESKPLP